MKVTTIIIALILLTNISSASTVHKISFGVDNEETSFTEQADAYARMKYGFSAAEYNTTVVDSQPNYTPYEQNQAIIDNNTTNIDATQVPTQNTDYTGIVIKFILVVLVLVLVASIIRYLYLRYV